jgi:hypothetical protein
MEREITTFGPACSNATAAALADALAGSWQVVNDRKALQAVASSSESLRRVES